MAVTWKRLCYDDEPILKTFMTAKGDLISASADDTPVILPIGNAGDILKVGGAGATGLLWEAPGGVNHDMFSAIHQDTTGVAAVVDGDVIIGNATPKWSKLAISIPAATFLNVFGVANGELRSSWKALFDATVPTTIAPSDSAAAGTAVAAARRDHKHAAPATFPPSTHALSAHSAAAANISMGGNQLTDIVDHLVADAAARVALTPVVGKRCFQVDTLSMYVCTTIA
jgi:hypothetical protein